MTDDEKESTIDECRAAVVECPGTHLSRFARALLRRVEECSATCEEHVCREPRGHEGAHIAEDGWDWWIAGEPKTRDVVERAKKGRAQQAYEHAWPDRAFVSPWKMQPPEVKRWWYRRVSRRKP